MKKRLNRQISDSLDMLRLRSLTDSVGDQKPSFGILYYL